MTTLALEIHDAGILAADASGVLDLESPGYALYDGGTVLTGEAALHRAREQPRWVHRRFWLELDTEPLGRPFPRSLSPADLAHAHLAEIWRAAPEGISSVVLAIPGSFSTRQLGLILGIARSCGLPVDGMVDLAVAAAAAGHSNTKGAPRLLHLDLHLHRTVLTELAVSVPAVAETAERRLIRGRVQLGEGLGLAVLQEVWARRIAELFVHATRFDPLHSAATEQALYHRLPEWLARLRSEEIIVLDLGPEGNGRSLELTRQDLVTAIDKFYDSLLELVLSSKPAGESLTVLLSHRIAELPGLEPRLAELRGVTTVPLPRAAAAAGALEARDQIRSSGAESADQAPLGDPAGALPFVTRLSYQSSSDTAPSDTASSATASSDTAPSATASSAAASSAAAATAPAAAAEPDSRPVEDSPTHLVHEGLAYPISVEPFLLGTGIGGERGLELTGLTAGISRSHCRIWQQDGRVVVVDHSTYGTFLGAERVDGRAELHPGDRLRLGTPGIEIQLIRVVKTSRSHPGVPSHSPSHSHPSGVIFHSHPSRVT